MQYLDAIEAYGSEAVCGGTPGDDDSEYPAPDALDWAQRAGEAAYLAVCRQGRTGAWRLIVTEVLLAALDAIAEDDDVPFVTLAGVNGSEVAVSAEALADRLGIGGAWRDHVDGNPSSLDQLLESHEAGLGPPTTEAAANAE